MNIKVLQYQVVFGDLEANLERVQEVFAKENLKGTDVVVLPEMWTSSYDLENIKQHACHHLEPAKSIIVSLAQEYDVNIVAGSVANMKADPEKVYNTAFVIDRKGKLIYEYSKMHLVPMLNEPEFLAAGRDKVNTFMLDGNTCGIVICYDLRFPELFRDLALKGATSIFVVAEWPMARKSHWETLTRARAIENQLYIIAADTYGEIGDQKYAGRSMIVGPFGESVDEAADHGDATLTGRLDGSEVDRIRKEVPIFDSRKREMYHFL
ncbi:carbon-nitrogen family hydrolase [Salinicoccus hispanicus]|uniref:Carbon-nitrogen family hydrolase n=1 Tax=Salinicoccus hispanicus TaxID=157225 RepID=A0A6N8U1V5_9STAP|nr:carbon-nitrogen family hydrolase [Salinicoccus hispanicus]